MSATRLYLGQSIADLNKLAEVKVDHTTHPRIYCNTAAKVYQGAATNSVKGDEEKAFVLYMRYCSIVTQLKKSPAYKKHKAECDKILFGTNIAIAVGEAERLSTSLSKRYESLTGARTDGDGAKDENDDSDTIKLPSVPTGLREGPDGSASITSSLDVYELLKVGPSSVLEPKKVGQNEVNVRGLVTDVSHSNGIASSTSISPTELFDLLKADAKVLILDTRSAESFNASRMTKGDLVNIPEDLLVAGIGPGLILMNLKPQFRDLWTDRKHADHVILIDYDTTMEKFHKNPTLPIGNLKEAIYKFDSQVTLKSEPRLLDGGFHNWILHYPTFVTDSNWKREEVKGKSDGSLIDEHLDYPELPGEKKVEKKGDGNHQVPQQPPSNSKPEPSKKLLPIIPDRSQKPQQNNLNSNSGLPAGQQSLGETSGSGHCKPGEPQSGAPQRPEHGVSPSVNKVQPTPQQPVLPSSQPTHNLPGQLQASTHTPPSYSSSSSYPLVIPSTTPPTPPNPAHAQLHEDPSRVQPRGDTVGVQPCDQTNSYPHSRSQFPHNAPINRMTPDHPRPQGNNPYVSVNANQPMTQVNGSPHPTGMPPPQQPAVQPVPPSVNPVLHPGIQPPAQPAQPAQSTLSQPPSNQIPVSPPKPQQKILPDVVDQPKPLNNRNTKDTVVAIDPRVPLSGGEVGNLLSKPTGSQNQEEKYSVGKVEVQHPGSQGRARDMSLPGSQPVVTASDSSAMHPSVLPQQQTVCTPVPKLEAKDSQPVNVPSTERPGVPAPSVSITPQPAFASVGVPIPSVIPPQQQISQPTGEPSKQDTPLPHPSHVQPLAPQPGTPQTNRHAVPPANLQSDRLGVPLESNVKVQPHDVSQPQGPGGSPHATHTESPPNIPQATLPRGEPRVANQNGRRVPHAAPTASLPSPIMSAQTKPQSDAAAVTGSHPYGGVRTGYGPMRPEDQRGAVMRQMPRAHMQPVAPAVQRPVQSRVPQPHWLPAGWERGFDDRTGRYYFKDHTMKSTHWQLPQAVLQHIAADQSRKQPVASRERSNSGTQLGQQPVERPTVDRGRKPQPETVQPTPTIDRSSKPHAYRPPHKKRDIAPVFGSVGRVLTGLRNLGNTCFMNSVVQCLGATTPLSSYFISGSYVKDVNVDNPLGMKGEIAEEFGFVVKSLWSGQFRSIAPYDFKFSISRFAPQFSGSQQQDSQELMAFLLDGLHEDLNRVIVKAYVEEKDTTSIPDLEAARISWTNHLKRNNSIIVDMFQGQFRNTMMCLSCHKQSVTFQAFMYLSLPLPSSHRCSLTDCLEFFRRREKVSGEDKWYCPHCKQLREATKQLEIWKLPRILLIHLKRFSFKGLWRQKLDTDVSFPVSALNVNTYVAGPEMPGNYDLYAVSNHTGDLNGGHYTAYCRNPFNRKWYTFDDKDVSDKSESGVRSRAAYILFYTSVDFRPTSMSRSV